jgi:hypothetical protein
VTDDLERALAIALTMPAAATADRARLVQDRAERRSATDRATVDTHVQLYRRLLEALR